MTAIKGYRELNQTEIQAINRIKDLAEDVGFMIEQLEGTVGIDQRWLAIAKTDLQKGFMSFVRSVAQPSTF
ncbi:MAG: hypothetical protein B7X61_15790 [Gallionellales bacterium 39-52-133]|jgi:hypothetical protein|nr:MAG: hypothetical protein B7X61_15790 [Gallionellales bacterium 39-52-133]